MNLSWLIILWTLLMASAGCGSKSALGIGDLSEEDTSVADVGPVDTSSPDGGFDTFPCSWSYSRPVELGWGTDFRQLLGAVHGRNDVVWLHTNDVAAGDGRLSLLVALGDPPRIIGDAPAIPRNGRVHGLTDGWVSLAGDCSLAFFDDEARPLRLILPPIAEPPCFLERIDPSFVDVTAMSPPLTAHRFGTRGEPVHSVATESFGYGHTTVSPDGARIVVASQDPGLSAAMLGLYDVASGANLAQLELEGLRPGLSLGIDRIRPVALALFDDEAAGATLMRFAFDAAEFAPDPYRSEGSPLLGQAEGALAVNETEGLFPLEDGRLLAQPLSGTGPRFLETPAPGVERLTVILAPGQSRGGVFYAHPEPDGTTALSFRTLTCNR